MNAIDLVRDRNSTSEFFNPFAHYPRLAQLRETAGYFFNPAKLPHWNLAKFHRLTAGTVIAD
jgi:hypothetical protein